VKLGYLMRPKLVATTILLLDLILRGLGIVHLSWV